MIVPPILLGPISAAVMDARFWYSGFRSQILVGNFCTSSAWFTKAAECGKIIKEGWKIQNLYWLYFHFATECCKCTPLSFQLEVTWCITIFHNFYGKSFYRCFVAQRTTFQWQSYLPVTLFLSFCAGQLLGFRGCSKCQSLHYLCYHYQSNSFPKQRLENPWWLSWQRDRWYCHALFIFFCIIMQIPYKLLQMAILFWVAIALAQNTMYRWIF